MIDNVRPRGRDFSRGRYKHNVAAATGLRDEEIADVDFHYRLTYFLIHVDALQRFIHAVNTGTLGLGSADHRPVVLPDHDPLAPATLSARERASIPAPDHRARVADQHRRRLERLLDGLARRSMPSGTRRAVTEFTTRRLVQLATRAPSSSTFQPSEAPVVSTVPPGDATISPTPTPSGAPPLTTPSAHVSTTPPWMRLLPRLPTQWTSPRCHLRRT